MRRIKNVRIYQFMTVILLIALVVLIVPDFQHPFEDYISRDGIIIAIILTSIGALILLQRRRKKFLKRWKK